MYKNEEKQRTSQPRRPLCPDLREEQPSRLFPILLGLQKRSVRVFAGIEDVFRLVKDKDDSWLCIGRDGAQNGGGPMHRSFGCAHGRRRRW